LNPLEPTRTDEAKPRAGTPSLHSERRGEARPAGYGLCSIKAVFYSIKAVFCSVKAVFCSIKAVFRSIKKTSAEQ
jgi:hypothetical protein